MKCNWPFQKTFMQWLDNKSWKTLDLRFMQREQFLCAKVTSNWFWQNKGENKSKLYTFKPFSYLQTYAITQSEEHKKWSEKKCFGEKMWHVLNSVANVIERNKTSRNWQGNQSSRFCKYIIILFRGKLKLW